MERSVLIFAFEDSERAGDVGLIVRNADIVECEGELVPIVRMSCEEAVEVMDALHFAIGEALNRSR